MCIAMICLPACESSVSAAGPCSDWELVLHAFFDGELDAVDSFRCEKLLGQCQGCFLEVRNLKSMRRKIQRSAVSWPARGRLRNRIGWSSLTPSAGQELALNA